TIRVATRGLSAYCLPVSGFVYVIVRRTASIRFAWPDTTFAQVGDVASSKSAMNTCAPELSALMIILRSVGPVISTRRSCRSRGAAATLQSAAQMAAVNGRQSVRPALLQL